MKNSKKLSLLCIISLFQSPIMSKMQPIIRDGRYYYDTHDTHEHINLEKALYFLGRKLAPARLISTITSYFNTTPEEDQKDEKIDPIGFLPPLQSIPAARSIEPKITWIGHATFLIQINGFNILTDPIFGPVKVGPIALSKRVTPPGIKITDLPPIDAIVISHNHPDHMDTATLKFLAQKYQPTILVPKGNKDLVRQMGFEDVIESNWWEKYQFIKDGRSIYISCLPAYHWSIRFSLDSYRKALWSSWMMSAETNIYFAGDTAYGPHFKEIAAEFPSINVALMPISPTHKGENKHKHSHTDALEAIDAFIDLNAHWFIPMHYATFSLKNEALAYPLNKLHAYWQEKSDELKDKKLLVAQCGNGYSL